MLDERKMKNPARAEIGGQRGQARSRLNLICMRLTALQVGLLLFGLAVLVSDLLQDAAHVQAVLAVNGWNGRLMGEVAAATVRNLALLFGLVLAVRGSAKGWMLMGVIAVFMTAKRLLWFWVASPAFDNLGSLSSQAALSTADLLFRLLCVAALVDVLRRQGATASQRTNDIP